MFPRSGCTSAARFCLCCGCRRSTRRILGLHQILPVGLSSEPPEMPGLCSALGAPEVVGLFLWELGKNHLTCSCFSICPHLMSLAGGGSGAQFYCGHSQWPPKTMPSPGDVIEVRVWQSPI